MDAASNAQGIIEQAQELLGATDFIGAEELLMAALTTGDNDLRFLIHHQLGVLYARWDKLTSAVHHFHHAIDGAQLVGNEAFALQAGLELKEARRRQASQKP